MIQARVWSCRKLMGNHCTRTPYCRKVRPLPSELASLMEIMLNLISKSLLEPFDVHKPCAASDENGDRNSHVLKRAWSCICCCSRRNKAQAWCQKGSCLVTGKVHPVSRIEKWEEKITEAKTNDKILVVNFKASWCLPCKKIAPIYQELASTYTSMIFVTIDVEELAEFSNEWNVEATPTVVFLKDGRQMDKLVGGDAAELQKKTAAAADLLLRS